MEISLKFHEKGTEMERNGAVKMAIHNMGGTKHAGAVSVSTIGKWIRNGVIPNMTKAELVAQESGFSLASLRPRFEQKAV